jgi:hypothetical protein
MRLFGSSLLTLSLCILLAGCGSNSSTTAITGTAKLVNGATSVARLKSPQKKQRPHNERATTWQVTPDTLVLTLNKLQFLNASGSGDSIALTNCTATFDKTKAGLANLSSCSFTVAPGTYYGMFLYVNPTVTATINDTVNNFYTNGTGIVTSPPGTVAASSFTYTSSGGASYGADGFTSLSVFGTPLTVTAESAPEVTVVIDGIHAIKVSVNGSTATFVGDGDTVGHPDYVVSANGVGRVAYYMDSSLTFADAMTYTGSAFAKIFYTGDGTPTTLFSLLGSAGDAACGSGTGQANNVSAANFVLNSTNANPSLKYGGYLGRDSSASRLKWARASGASWSSYISVVTLDEKTAIGETTAFKCQTISSDPAPTGDTFNGTISAISSPSATVSLKLVAK